MTWLINFHPAGAEEFIALTPAHRIALILRLLQAEADGLTLGFFANPALISEASFHDHLLCGVLELQDTLSLHILFHRSWVRRHVTVLAFCQTLPDDLQIFCDRHHEREHAFALNDFLKTLPVAEVLAAQGLFNAQASEIKLRDGIRNAHQAMCTDFADYFYYTPLKSQRFERRCDLMWQWFNRHLAEHGCEMSLVVRTPDGSSREFTSWRQIAECE